MSSEEHLVVFRGSEGHQFDGHAEALAYDVRAVTRELPVVALGERAALHVRAAAIEQQAERRLARELRSVLAAANRDALGRGEELAAPVRQLVAAAHRP